MEFLNKVELKGIVGRVTTTKVMDRSVTNFSLILSARDKDGNPIETIEVDLQSFKILQCYGKGDTFTPMHKTIVRTMNKNMGLIKELRRAS